MPCKTTLFLRSVLYLAEFRDLVSVALLKVFDYALKDPIRANGLRAIETLQAVGVGVTCMNSI